MTTLSLTAGTVPRDRVEQVGLFSLIGMVAAAQLSIAIAEILLAVAVLCWFVLHVTRRERLEAPAFFWPLIGYAMLTLLAAGFSQNPVISVADCKQLSLFLLVQTFRTWEEHLRQHTGRLTGADQEREELAHTFAVEVTHAHLFPAVARVERT